MNIAFKGDGQCDSPLERGAEVCYPADISGCSLLG
jgi:hypothetical protein